MKMPVFGKALLLGGGWIWIEEDRESEGILALALVPCFYVDIYSRRTYWFIFCSINIYWAFFMCQCLGCSNKMVNSTKRISLIFKFFFLFFLRKMFFFSHSWVGFLTCILSGNIKHEQKMVSKSSLPAPSSQVDYRGTPPPHDIRRLPLPQGLLTLSLFYFLYRTYNDL